MQRKGKLAKFILLVLHKFNRYSAQQRVFILYLLVVAFFLIISPILNVQPVGSQIDDTANAANYSVYLLSTGFFKVMLIMFISMGILLAWNMSFRFKNIVISYL